MFQINIELVFWLFGAYLLGSISTAVIVSRVMGLADPRASGSQNPGATNMLRLSGKVPALLTLLGDMLKGTLPVVLWYSTGGDIGGAVLVLTAAFLGHVFPVFLRFQGGKGVATALGGLLGFYPLLAFVVVLNWLVSALLFRHSSLAAMSAFIGLPIYAAFLSGFSVAIPFLGVSTIIIWRHKANIVRLLEDTEGRLF